MSTDRGETFQSNALVVSVVGYGLPSVFMAAGLGWFGLQGYPLAWLGSLLFGAAALQGCYLAVRGGVRIVDSFVEIRGWFRREVIQKATVEAVWVRTGAAGEPVGWFATTTGRAVKLRGATVKHRHGLANTGPCAYCLDDRLTLAKIAQSLGVPLVDAPPG